MQNWCEWWSLWWKTVNTTVYWLDELYWSMSKIYKIVEFHFHIYNHRRDFLELKYSTCHSLSTCNTKQNRLHSSHTDRWLYFLKTVLEINYNYISWELFMFSVVLTEFFGKILKHLFSCLHTSSPELNSILL